MRDALRDAFTWIDNAIAQVDLVEWFLIGIGLVLLWHVLVVLFNRNKLGPVAVIDFADPSEATEDKGAGSRLAVQIRKRLASLGAQPDVGPPAGRPESELEAVVRGSPIPQATWVASLLSSLRSLVSRLVGRGFRVEGALGAIGDEKEITLTLIRNFLGRLTSVTSFRAPTYEEAVDHAAAWVYIQVDAATRRPTVAWRRWTDPKALACFWRGEDCERKGATTEALAAYESVRELQAHNALPWMAIANRREVRALEVASNDAAALSALLDAALAYEHVAHHWSSVTEARYRLATLYSFVDRWDAANAAASGDAAARDRLATLTGPLEADLATWLRTRATNEYDTLVRRTLSPKRRRMVRLARYSVKPDGSARTVKRVRKLAWRADWQGKYNAACYFALLIAKDNVHGDEALELLDEVVASPDSALPPGWIARDDPDLEPLRSWVPATPTADVTKRRRRVVWATAFEPAD